MNTSVSPPTLFGAFREEPAGSTCAASARTSCDCTFRHFRGKVAGLASLLHGLPKDEMLGEDVNQHSRTRRLVRGTIAVLITLTLLASVAAAVAIVQQRETHA